MVEGRLRVYAEKWRVWADAPVGERYESTPYWAFRRWPAQVSASPPRRRPPGRWWSPSGRTARSSRSTPARGPSPGGPARRSARGGPTTAAGPGRPPSTTPRIVAHRAVGDQTMRGGHRPGYGAARSTRPPAKRYGSGTCRPVRTGRIHRGRAVRGAGLRRPDVAFVAAPDGAQRGHLDRAGEPAGARPQPALCELNRSNAGWSPWAPRPGCSARRPATSPPHRWNRARCSAGDRVVYPTTTGVRPGRWPIKDPLWTWRGRARSSRPTRSGSTSSTTTVPCSG